MKGIELPINVLIIVAIAIIVLIALVGMFYSPVNQSGDSVSLDIAKSQACRSLVIGYDCKDISTSKPLASHTAGTGALILVKVDNYDVDGIGGANSAGDTLWKLCNEKYYATTDSDCRKLCGCAA